MTTCVAFWQRLLCQANVVRIGDVTSSYDSTSENKFNFYDFNVKLDKYAIPLNISLC